MPAAPLAPKLLQILKPELPNMLASWSPSSPPNPPALEKAPADRCCELIATEWRKTGLEVERIAKNQHGEVCASSRQQLLLPPADQKTTAQSWAITTPSTPAARYRKCLSTSTPEKPSARHLRHESRNCPSPLRSPSAAKTETPLAKQIVFLWTSDEEIGSESSRNLIETEARRSDAVFVLEPSLGPRGLLKTERKGVGEAEIIVHGRASHAGLAPEKGINAIHELSHQLTKIRGRKYPRAARPSMPISSKGGLAPT